MLNKNIKSVRFLILFLSTLLIGSCRESLSMESLRNACGSLANAPATISGALTRLTIFSWAGMKYTKRSTEELIEDINQGIESHIPNTGLCSVAAFSACLGTYHAINNIDADKKPEQSARKFWFGTGLAFFSTAFLYTKYRGIEHKRAQRALNRLNTPPVTPGPAATPTAATSSLTTTTTTTSTITSSSRIPLISSRSFN